MRNCSPRKRRGGTEDEKRENAREREVSTRKKMVRYQKRSGEYSCRERQRDENGEDGEDEGLGRE